VIERMPFKSAIGLASRPAFLLRMKTEFRGLKFDPSRMSKKAVGILLIGFNFLS
jgi:hypothetical protein